MTLREGLLQLIKTWMFKVAPMLVKALYFISLFLIGLAGYAYQRTSKNLGMRPNPNSFYYPLYMLFGPISGLLFVALLATGFFLFEWWVPVISFVATSLLYGWIFWKNPLYSLHFVIYGFPAGVIMTMVMLLVD